MNYIIKADDFLEAIFNLCPKYDRDATLIYVCWLLFQAVCYSFLPGPVGYGQMTPAGYTHPYIVNGITAYILTHVLYFGLSIGFGLFSPTVIADYHGGLLFAAWVYGYLISTFAYIKGAYFPSFPNDRKFSGSVIYDYMMGIELNPRIGKLFDLKLFHNGRPGIIAWTLINLSFAAA